MTTPIHDILFDILAHLRSLPPHAARRKTNILLARAYAELVVAREIHAELVIRALNNLHTASRKRLRGETRT